MIDSTKHIVIQSQARSQFPSNVNFMNVSLMARLSCPKVLPMHPTYSFAHTDGLSCSALSPHSHLRQQGNPVIMLNSSNYG